MKALRLLPLLLLLTPLANAAPTASGGSGTGIGTKCMYWDVVSVTAQNTAGQMGYCVNYPETVSSNTAVWQLGVKAMGPAAPATVTMSYVFSSLTATGCTAGSITQNTFSNGATSGGSMFATITMTSDQCYGSVHLDMKSGATVLIPVDIGFNTEVPFTNQAVAQSGSWQIDNQNRQCAASTFGASCTLQGKQNIANTCASTDLATFCIQIPDAAHLEIVPTAFQVWAFLDYSPLGTTGLTPSFTLNSLGGDCALGSTAINGRPDGSHEPRSTYYTQTFRLEYGNDNGGEPCNGSVQAKIVDGGGNTKFLMTIPFTLNPDDVVRKQEICAPTSFAIDQSNPDCFTPTYYLCQLSPSDALSGSVIGANPNTVTGQPGTTHCSGGGGNSTNTNVFPSEYTVHNCGPGTGTCSPMNGTAELSFPGDLSKTRPGLDWWIEATFWLAVFAFCIRYKSLWVLTFAIPGSLHLISSTWFFDLPHSIPWLGLGALIEILLAMNRKRLETKKEEPRNVT